MTQDPFTPEEALTIESLEHYDGPEPVPDELLEKAVKRMQSVVKGNGLRGLQVALGDFEGEIIRFETYEVFKMDPQIAEKRINGKQNGEVVGSSADMHAKMTALQERITENVDVKKFVIDILKKRPDLGYALENQSISMDKHNKNFVVHELCTSCSGSKMFSCSTCHGDGRVTCHRCRGSMLVECPLCQGHRTIAAGGGRKTCTKCNGRGKAPCNVCRGKGVTPCINCKGTGRLSCQPCGATGWHSLIGTLTLKAKCHFWYDKEALVAAEEAPELPILIDGLGVKLKIEEHADIQIIESQERLKELDREVKGNEFKIPYRVRLPWGSISFRLKDQVVHGKLFGFHPELVYMETFLEEPLKPGLYLLEQAAANTQDPTTLIKKAAPYRAIGEALVLSARLNPYRATEEIKKRYPFGLREETLQTMIIQADRTLKNVTRKPRQIGLIVGSVATFLILGGLYFAGLQENLHAQLPSTLAQVAIELLIWPVLLLLTTSFMKFGSTHALRLALSHLLPAKKLKTISPKLGKAGFHAVLIISFLWLAAAPLTFFTGKPVPAWFNELMILLGYF